MKRRDAIKNLSILPLAGGALGLGSSLDVSGSPATPPGLGAFKPGPEIFRAIGVEPVINCRGTFTIIGGSLERTSVRQAMEAASRSFVQYDELADGIGQKLAELTGAEWGMVSAGCAAGLKHVTAACVTGGNPEKLIRIPDLAGFDKTEVIIPRSSRNVYDHAIRNIGVKIITVDNNEELERAISSRTAMIYADTDDVEAIAKIANAKNVPFLVDAAANDLTVPNIYLKQGATIVAYSGGKALCGPQCSGLVIGRKDILKSAWQASSPHHGPGRDNKVGREEMFGLLAAVEAWLSMDHKAQWTTWLSYLQNIAKILAKVEGVSTQVYEPEGLDNHSPVLNVTWEIDKLNVTGEELAEELGRSKPRIAIGGQSPKDKPGYTAVNITAGQMQPGEDKIVGERLAQALSMKRPPRPGLAAPSGTIAGRWDVNIEFFSSKSSHTWTLEQDGNWLTGMHKGDFSVRDISGSLEGSKIKLRSIDVHTGDHIPFIFTGTLSGESITGDIFMGEYRTATFKAERHVAKIRREPIMVPGGPPLAT